MSTFSTDLRKRPRPSGPIREARAEGLGPWDREVSLDVGGLRFELAGVPRLLERDLAVHFGPAVLPSGDGGPAELRIQVRPAIVGTYLDFSRQGDSREYAIETRVRDGKLHAWSYAFAGWFAIDGAEGEICLCENPIESPERSIENFLRVAFSWRAARLGGLLLHASGLVRQGRAYLFFGPSGIGKTTIARLSPYELLLNDDCIHVTSRAPVFMASGVCFKAGEDRRAQGSFPVAGLFRLVQSTRAACDRIPAARAVGELMTSIPFVTERPEGAERLFGTVEAMVRAVPVMRLQFRLSPDFWNPIEEALRG